MLYALYAVSGFAIGLGSGLLLLKTVVDNLEEDEEPKKRFFVRKKEQAKQIQEDVHNAFYK